MKLFFIGLCCVGFVAAMGKEYKIRISGKIQCCSEVGNNAMKTTCKPPYKAEIELIDQFRFFPNAHIETIELTKGEGEYLLEWKNEFVSLINPLLKARIYCEKDQIVSSPRFYDWSDNNKTNIEQNIIVNY